MDDAKFLEEYNRIRNEISELKKTIARARQNWALELKELSQRPDYEQIKDEKLQKISDKYAMLFYKHNNKLAGLLALEAQLLEQK